MSARRRRQRGFVLVMMAVVALGVLAASGLALDLGRLFIAKQETQTYVDAGALAAALELDGTATGITRATSAATQTGNKWNMNTSNPTGAVVEFGTTPGGPWTASPANPASYMYARVRVTVAASLYFMPLVARRSTQDVVSSAVAGKLVLNHLSYGLVPYTVIAQNPGSPPDFGLTRRQSYTIQWPAMRPSDNSKNCKQNNPAGCFVRDPCPGDSKEVMWNVHNNWSAATNGYWGFNGSADIRASILDGKQTVPIAIGDNLYEELSNGNMASQARVLDDRSQQDNANDSNNVNSYLADASQNGRRLIAVPIVEVVSSTQTVVRGFGQFLLYSNGNSSNYYQRNTNGNDAYCAIYVGTYTVGSNNPGGNSSTGATYVSLLR